LKTLSVVKRFKAGLCGVTSSAIPYRGGVVLIGKRALFCTSWCAD